MSTAPSAPPAAGSGARPDRPAGEVRPIHRLLVANRGEIAIRVFRACSELGIRAIGIYAHEDRFSLHRFKADEAYQVGELGEPVKSYLDIPRILEVARKSGERVPEVLRAVEELREHSRALANAAAAGETSARAAGFLS